MEVFEKFYPIQEVTDEEIIKIGMCMRDLAKRKGTVILHINISNIKIVRGPITMAYKLVCRHISDTENHYDIGYLDVNGKPFCTHINVTEEDFRIFAKGRFLELDSKSQKKHIETISEIISEKRY
jgi:hypothetical protein